MLKIILHSLLYSSIYAMEFSMDQFYKTDKESIQPPKLGDMPSPKEDPYNYSPLVNLNEKLNKLCLPDYINNEILTKDFPYFGTTEKNMSAIAFLLFAQKVITTNPEAIGNYYTHNSPLFMLNKYYQEMRTHLNILQSQYPDLISLKYMSEKAIIGFVNKHCFETCKPSEVMRISAPYENYWGKYE